MRELAEIIELLSGDLLPSQTDTYNSLKEKTRQEAFTMNKDKAYDYIRKLPYCPRSPRGREASNKEKYQWLENHSIEINRKCPGPNDLIDYPINSLIFFPTSKNKCTML